MALSDTAVRKVKPSGKPYKLPDGDGLYLYVTDYLDRLKRGAEVIPLRAG